MGSNTGHPLLAPLSTACGFISIITYNTKSVGSLGLLVSMGTAVVSLWGIWVVSPFVASIYLR